MKGIDNIVKAILSDAEADVKATKKLTKQQIQQLRDKLKSEVEKELAVFDKETSKKTEELKRREKTIMDVEIRRNNLMVKRVMVNKSFDMAYEALCSLDSSSYEDIVRTMMLGAVETGREEVIAGTDKKIDQKLIDQVNKQLKSQNRTGELTLSKDAGKFAGGLVLRSEGVETNCTFGMLIKQIKPQIESEVAGILFG